MLLSRDWMEQQPDTVRMQKSPEKILQIGEGNFMRGFVDWLIHRLIIGGKYDGRVVVATPLAAGEEKIRQWNRQDGLYTVWQRGMENGQLVDSPEVVQSVSRCLNPYTQWQEFLDCARKFQIDTVISNTTEAGLTYNEEPYDSTRCPTSFPAKLTAYLYARYVAFDGEAEAGLDIIPCELVENNGDVLKNLVLRYVRAWELPVEFAAWVESSNRFYNTLVDSIITGFNTADPADLQAAVPYEDKLGVIREPFYLWVIQGSGSLQEKWDFPSLGLNVRYVQDVTPYRLIKVRVLNGAHTALAGLSFLSGLKTVRQAITDDTMGPFVRGLISEEIIPALTTQGVAQEEAEEFAKAVLERFENPLLHHEVASLQLNGLSKIAVRLLPTLRDYFFKTGSLPRRLALAIAGQLLYYRNAEKPDERWTIKDNQNHVELVQELWNQTGGDALKTVVSIFQLQQVWGQDLSAVPGLAELVAENIVKLRKNGIRNTVAQTGDNIAGLPQ